MSRENRKCYYTAASIIMIIIIVISTIPYLIWTSTAPQSLKIIITALLASIILLPIFWLPKDSRVVDGGVLLIGVVRRKFIAGEVVEEYTSDEVKWRLSFVPVGNRVSLQCFFWGLYGSFMRRNGEWVSVDVYAGRDCKGKWLLLKKRGQERYLLVCPGNT
ncbi:hypothetical protein [Pyrobaculum aerophilum]|uniref:Uncharacterized protein n=1 Tax=Pyrobaculum aerophilum TaxID=13773 RepID=A0A371QXP2_9CREN|nr:hypothetical protein [Pyrobaculum aerophilum]RFA94633.1 hypothetical protein CGL51_09605 [Pyrobaculum aerophilum]RFA95099.1 hypothetical protein CGL52_13240 [Pyrobaculum aerophilum]